MSVTRPPPLILPVLCYRKECGGPLAFSALFFIKHSGLTRHCVCICVCVCEGNRNRIVSMFGISNCFQPLLAHALYQYSAYQQSVFVIKRVGGLSEYFWIPNENKSFDKVAFCFTKPKQLLPNFVFTPALICNYTVLISLNGSTFCFSQQVVFHLMRSHPVLIVPVSMNSFVIGSGN